ncbi:hypothetical protein PR003_g26751 [Phytophthora rubi]|uniref:Uncharacterized protein n=1 Tax=Phytophthora rubi TaxID=129364 RepID=A0A6A3HZC2_9STRA|nr:hypothetical protein PR002_g26003 [Phytophthora rubi]KAE8976018.1 hypothetical protein PR001_g25541 [Phytophthora rubi]KAE9284842.1 hypothetical protein PR003_g26751 [Phytophthora rubi]
MDRRHKASNPAFRASIQKPCIQEALFRAESRRGWFICNATLATIVMDISDKPE